MNYPCAAQRPPARASFAIVRQSRADQRRPRATIPSPRLLIGLLLTSALSLSSPGSIAGENHPTPATKPTSKDAKAKPSPNGLAGDVDACNDCVLPGPLFCGTSSAGELGVGDCVSQSGRLFETRTMNLPEAARVTVRLTSAEFAPVLRILNAACEEIAINVNCNDDGGLESCLTRSLPAGDYYIVVSANDFGSGGAYVIELECVAGFSVCDDCNIGRVNCGDDIARRVSVSDCRRDNDQPLDLYSFVVEDGGPVRISAESSDFDTYLLLYAEDCTILRSNDDCIGRNSCIETDLPPGSYHIGVSSFGASAVGTFQLSTRCPDVSFCEDCAAGTLDCGSLQSGDLSGARCGEDGVAEELWRFELPASAPFHRLEIRLDAALGTSMTLLDRDCQEIPDVAITPSGDKTVLRHDQLPAGDYSVHIASLVENAGRYDVQIDCETWVACRDCTVGTPLKCGTPVTGDLSNPACALPPDGRGTETWTFELESPLRVTLRVDSTAPLGLELRDENCNSIRADSGCDNGQGACLVADLDAGTYSVLVSAAGKSADEYNLNLECQSISTCEDCNSGALICNEPTSANLSPDLCSFEDGSYFASYDLTVDTESTIEIDLRSEEFDTFLWLYDAACLPIASNDDCRGTLNSCLSSTLEPGNYFVLVSTFSPGATGTYELTASSESPCGLCSRCTVGEIACSERVTRELGADSCRLQEGGAVDLWALNLVETKELDVVLQSDAFDTVLELYDSNCRVVDRNDDCNANTLNSCLGLALEPGSYYLAVSGFFPESVGAYELSVDCRGEGGLQLPGDCNGDSVLNITDGLCLLNQLFIGSSAANCGAIRFSDSGSADFDGSGDVQITDPVALFTYLFLGGPPHALGEECTSVPFCEDRCSL